MVRPHSAKKNAGRKFNTCKYCFDIARFRFYLPLSFPSASPTPLPPMKPQLVFALALVLALPATPLHAAKKPTKPGKAETPEKTAGVQGWLDWRGPFQTGVSLEKGLPDKVDGKAALWSADFPGQSAPVIANGKLYIMGFTGEGPELQEGVACFDAETGKLL